MLSPIFAEDSNVITLAPNLANIVEKLGNDANKNDFLMAFIITIMAENGYRISSLYNEKYDIWNKEVTCIPINWKSEHQNLYSISFLSHKSKGVGFTLIGIPVGDWIVLNLLPKGSSSKCKARSITVNVLKHVNMYTKELGKFWNLKELALRFKNNLLAPLHAEIMMEIGIASPCLQGLPQELKVLIFNMLDHTSKYNLQKICKDFINK